uniref:Endonuclease/exonuclease/phosphatase domain-containing protein n=1 Tax=Sipha flava TaxID=143950 RepID=A0A2S2Q8B9_9HEMI
MNDFTKSIIELNNTNAKNLIECSFNNLNTKMYTEHAINIISVNICILKKHFDELCIIIDNMETKFEVIVLTEAWLGLENVSINNFLMDGYTIHSTTNNKNQNNCVVVCLKYSLKDVLIAEIYSNALTILEIIFKISKIDFLIYSIYRSPNSILDIDLNDLNDLILFNSNFKTAKYKIILGDLNIDLLKSTKMRDDNLVVIA